MAKVLLNTKEDMQWVRDVHWPTLPAQYKSVVLEGNEDWPIQISAYRRKNPLRLSAKESLVTNEPLLRYPAVK